MRADKGCASRVSTEEDREAHLEKMLADGMFGFTRKAGGPRSFHVLCTVLAEV